MELLRALPRLGAARIGGRVDLPRHLVAVIDRGDGLVITACKRSGPPLGHASIVAVGGGLD